MSPIGSARSRQWTLKEQSTDPILSVQNLQNLLQTPMTRGQKQMQL